MNKSECDINSLIIEINKSLVDEAMYMGSCSYESIETIFDISPHEYLEFMEKDLDGAERRMGYQMQKEH